MIKSVDRLSRQGKQTHYLFLAYISLCTLILCDGHVLPYGTLSRLYFLPVLQIAWYGSRKLFAGILLCAMLLIALRYSGVWMASPPSLYISILDVGSILLYGATALFVRYRMDEEMNNARMDPLTGIYNRRGFEEEAMALCKASAKDLRPVSLAYIDLDHFKLLNDTLGHEVGDRLLLDVAQTIQGSVRSTDLVARLGGDEFIIMIPGAGPADVKAKLSKMRSALGELFDRNGWPVSASIGAVTFVRAPSIQQMIARADSVMYAVKRGTKDGLKYEITRGERVSTAVEIQ